MRKVLSITAIVLVMMVPAYADTLATFPDGKLDGWKTEGNAWGVTEMKREGISVRYHAESLVGGEQAVGVVRSDPFEITGTVLSFLANGWDGRFGGKGVNGYDLRRVDDGQILRTAVPPCSDAFSIIAWRVSDLKGVKVYFEAVDRDKGNAFAWLGFSTIEQEDVPLTHLRPMKLTGSSTWAVLERDGGGRRVAPYLSSLGGGEPGVGVVESPEFAVGTDYITFDLCGHDGEHGGLKQNFACLRDVRTGEALRTTYAPGNDAMVGCRWDVNDLKGKRVVFEICDGDPRDSFAWIGVNNIDAGPSMRAKFDSKALPAGWSSPQRGAEVYVSACGVPFLALSASQHVPYADGQAEITCGFRAREFYLLGMVNTWDRGNPAWGWPDYSQRLFIGDRAGDLVIDYADGTNDRIPLTFGYTMWWYKNYAGMGATEPFSSDPRAKVALERALCVYPTNRTDDEAYFCAVRPRDKVISAIRIVDSPKKRGEPAVSAITFDTDASSDRLSAPFPAVPATNAEREWLSAHTIVSAKPEPVNLSERLDSLRKVIYTSAADFAEAKPIEVPKGFRGPKIRFKGTPYADVLTNIYYHSTQDMDDKVDPDGTFHTSTKDAPSWGSYEGFGAWKGKAGPYYNHAWSRDLGRVLQELTELGYDSDSSACASWCNKQLMWFREQFPKVNVEGKPVPGHWVRIINHQEWTQTKGMPELFGNLENDGHGLIMLFEYKSWLNSGRRPDYVIANWDAIHEAAEYICWLFDNPKISRAKENVLFSDSEGGAMKYSIYCDVPCWLGLTAYAEMARTAGKTTEADRWQSYADRLKAGISSFYPQKDPKFGDIWDPNKAAVWPYGHSVLAPVIIWPDYMGFDLSGMPDSWLDRSRNTFRIQLAKCDPDHGSGIAMGYGQCFVTEAAILLDEMKDASKCLDRLAQFTYFPGYKPYIVPEGCEIDESRTWWHRTGDLGNAVQEGEGVKCVRLVLGIDDNNPNRTIFIPRMPEGWTEISAERYPVMTMEKGRVVRRYVDFRMERKAGSYRVNITADGPIAEASLRLGPYAPTLKTVQVTVNGKPMTLPTVRSGDSSWAWIKGLRNATVVRIATPAYSSSASLAADSGTEDRQE